MSGQTQFENDVLTALEAIRDRLPAYTETIQLGIGGAVVDFGVASAVTRTIAAPDGYTGKVMGVSLIRNAEVFTAGASIDVGTTTDTDAYYLGGAIAANSLSQHPAGTFRDYIPAGQDFVVTLNPVTAGAGGTGQAAVAITINWYED